MVGDESLMFGHMLSLFDMSTEIDNYLMLSLNFLSSLSEETGQLGPFIILLFPSGFQLFP